MDRIRLYDKTYRIIPSIYPPIKLFEDCVDSSELDALYALETLTSARHRNDVGLLSLVPHEDRVTGAGSSPLMAAFTHIGSVSRFTDGSFGVYYAALDEQTAIEETKFWQARMMEDTAEPPMSRDMRVYSSYIQGDISDLVDLRENASVHHLDDYSQSQQVAKQLRSQNEYGLVYNSVRKLTGICIAAFRPRIMSIPTQSAHIRYYWNGSEIDRVERVSSV